MERRITVTGTGTVRVRPDTMVVDGTITAVRPTSAEATAESARMLAELSDAVAGAGIDRDAVRASALSVSAEYSQARDDREPELIGYRFRQGVTVQVPLGDSRTGSLLEAMSASPDLRFHVGYRVLDQVVHEDEARRLAVADAVRKARVITEAAGTGLGEIVSIRDGEYESFREPRMVRYGMSSPDVAPEDESFTETVTIEWNLI